MCTTSPTAVQVLTMLWVNRTHIDTSPRSQPYSPHLQHEGAKLNSAAAGDGTERMSCVPAHSAQAHSPERVQDHPLNGYPPRTAEAAPVRATRQIGIRMLPKNECWSGRIRTAHAHHQDMHSIAPRTGQGVPGAGENLASRVGNAVRTGSRGELVLRGIHISRQ
jgi:hypothetical protein